ncbi:MAG TPA: hypothetical protein VIN03_28445 [Roseateles sp.]
MKVWLEKLLTPEVLLTMVVCLGVEALILVLAYQRLGDWLESAAFSAIVLGPVSLWLAPPLYRYMGRAGSS